MNSVTYYSDTQCKYTLEITWLSAKERAYLVELFSFLIDFVRLVLNK